jgi:hypothetical protein
MSNCQPLFAPPPRPPPSWVPKPNPFNTLPVQTNVAKPDNWMDVDQSKTNCQPYALGSHRPMTCFKCHQPGHQAAECPNVIQFTCEEYDEQIKCIAFHSQSFNNIEQNYEIFDKELLTIIRALKQWQHFLEGAEQPFEVHTDHHNLEYFKTMQDLLRQQACWSLFLSHFHFKIHYISGKTN